MASQLGNTGALGPEGPAEFEGDKVGLGNEAGVGIGEEALPASVPVYDTACGAAAEEKADSERVKRRHVRNDAGVVMWEATRSE